MSREHFVLQGLHVRLWAGVLAVIAHMQLKFCESAETSASRLPGLSLEWVHACTCRALHSARLVKGHSRQLSGIGYTQAAASCTGSGAGTTRCVQRPLASLLGSSSKCWCGRQPVCIRRVTARLVGHLQASSVHAHIRVLGQCVPRSARRVLCSSCILTDGTSCSPDSQVFVPSHPLVKHWLAVARNRLSPPPIFRSALAELGRVLIYEAAHDWLPTIDGQVCLSA